MPLFCFKSGCFEQSSKKMSQQPKGVSLRLVLVMICAKKQAKKDGNHCSCLFCEGFLCKFITKCKYFPIIGLGALAVRIFYIMQILAS
jgi:hypothetical protein